ncbi:Protein kinase superfamily protein [Abeliophyllum distichum]|uniref:non-specific serine/threonine protein kinase n=1 Tax=Abeliophyllum distichum TaxID=126358 RepID=A0ABD1R9M0_9LAMI
MGRERKSSPKDFANGNYKYKYHKDDPGHHNGDGSLVESSSRRMINYVDENEHSGQRKSVSSEKRHREDVLSPSHDKYWKEGYGRGVSKSPGQSRGRSRSESIHGEASDAGRQVEQDDAYYIDSEHRSDSDDERMSVYNRDYDMVGEMLDRERDRAREKERERKRKRKRERKNDKERQRTRLRDGDRAVRGRDREKDKERERGTERERGGEREKERVRVSERDRERIKENSRNRSRDRDRDSDRLNRRHIYDVEDVYGEQDRFNDSMHRRNSETDHGGRLSRNDPGNASSKSNPPETDGENLGREDNNQDEYQERIAMQLAEQEEDELERIREESRKRRQAILEKYKNQSLQQQDGTHSKDIVKEHDQVAAVDVPENFEGHAENEDAYVANPSFSIGKPPSQNELSAFERVPGTGGLGKGTPQIFTVILHYHVKVVCIKSFLSILIVPGKEGLGVERSGLHDNWDDAEGCYGYLFGEILDGRYKVIAAHGKGVFSAVVRAKDLKAKPGDHEEVAIKIIRNNEKMYKAGMEELIVLKKLVGADPEDKRHCVRYLSNFKYRNHLCLVLESLHMNLREVLKKFGRNIGLKLTAVRAYSKQLFIALKHLKNCGVHSDIKPDNMLVNEAKNVPKLCDFVSAMFAGKNEITPYLVSRFYRAPEIILGLTYDHAMDIWSVGCCLFELYTGNVLFPGNTNNDMLRLHMGLKGPFPKKMLRKGAFTYQHFDQDMNFLAIEDDLVTKKAIRRLIHNVKPRDIVTLISGSLGEDPKMLANFRDLLEKIFVLDPDKRIEVSQALSHPFITGK